MQSIIGMVTLRPKINLLIRYGFAVGVAAICLTVLNSALYPSTRFLFIFSNLQEEQESAFPWQTASNYERKERVKQVASSLLVYNVFAPESFQSIREKEDRGEFPKFNFLNRNIKDYGRAGNTALWIGAGLTLLALLSLLRNFRNVHRLSLALAICLAFNFGLHIFYGFEPYLYVADWTYAWVLFIALLLLPWTEKKWLQIILMIFLSAIMLNNLHFFQFMLDIVAPFFSSPA